MEQVTILHMIESLGRGGAERVLLNSLKYVDKSALKSCDALKKWVEACQREIWREKEYEEAGRGV